MKTLALDLGDRWVGSAISDALGITCRPYKTADAKDLYSFIEEVIQEEDIEQIIVGCPQTFSDTQSDQTKKIILQKEKSPSAKGQSAGNVLVPPIGRVQNF